MNLYIYIYVYTYIHMHIYMCPQFPVLRSGGEDS